MSAASEVDPVTLEIIQNSLQSVCDEMFAVMRKTSMSAIRKPLCLPPNAIENTLIGR